MKIATKMTRKMDELQTMNEVHCVLERGSAKKLAEDEVDSSVERDLDDTTRCS